MQAWKIQLYSYLAGMWKYRWYGIGLAWVVCVAGWVGVATVPSLYQSTATVYIDTDTLIRPLLRGLTVSPDPDQQVSVMLRTLVTRPNAEQALKLVDPSVPQMAPAALQAEVDNLQRSVSLRPLEAKNLFAVSYQNADPTYAQAVTQSLVSILVNTNLNGQRRDFEGVKSFLDEQIENYERMLREVESRRADFRVANIQFLTDTGASSATGKLDRAQAAVDEARAQLDAANARRESLRGQLARTPAILQVDAAVPIIITGDARGSALLQAQQRLEELRSRFTDDYPDVIAARKAVERLREQAVTGGTNDNQYRTRQGISNPSYVSLQSKLADEETNVALHQQRLGTARTNLEAAKNLMTEAISIERQYADLDRDYGVMQKNYQDLLARRESARLSQAVGDQQNSMVFRIIEAPERPERPVSPNRTLLNSVVLFAGVAAGAAAALLLSIGTEQFVVSDQLISAFNIPIVGVISSVPRHTDGRRRATYLLAAAVIGLLLLYLLALIAGHFAIL